MCWLWDLKPSNTSPWIWGIGRDWTKTGKSSSEELNASSCQVLHSKCEDRCFLLTMVYRISARLYCPYNCLQCWDLKLRNVIPSSALWICWVLLPCFTTGHEFHGVLSTDGVVSMENYHEQIHYALVHMHHHKLPNSTQGHDFSICSYACSY